MSFIRLFISGNPTQEIIVCIKTQFTVKLFKNKFKIWNKEIYSIEQTPKYKLLHLFALFSVWFFIISAR